MNPPTAPSAPPAAAGVLAAVAALALASSSLPAQVVSVDEAAFELSRDGQVIGREEITLQRAGIGADARIIGQSVVRLEDGTEMRPSMEADATFRATTYQNRFSGTESGELEVMRRGRRLVARTETAAGEAQREFPASDRTVLLETEVVLLYYLLSPWSDAGEPTVVNVLDPRTSRQTRMRVVPSGRETIRVGMTQMEATWLRLEGGAGERHVWIDDQGRVIRVRVPETGFSARRLPG